MAQTAQLRRIDEAETYFLDAAKGPDQRQQGGFSGSALARHDHDFAGLNGEAVVKKYLFLGLFCPEIVAHVLDVDRRILRLGFRNELGCLHHRWICCPELARAREF